MNTGIAPFPRGIRVLAFALGLSTVVLLTLGALTTSFRAGMADPVWPTEPWFLVVNGHKYSLEQHRGFLLEHTHRAAGFSVGILASIFAFAAWWSGPNRRARRWGLVALVGLLAAYGAFHGQMGKAWQARVARQEAIKQGIDVPPPEVFPLESGLATALFALGFLALSLAHLRTQQPGRWVRMMSGVLLICVMAQGLLGGYRVYLDQLLGPQLSQIHGVFAQLVFALMCCLPILCREPRADRLMPEADARSLNWLALALPGLVFVQLVWGVMVRHTAGALAQRLHILSAFLLLGVLIWLVGRIQSRTTTRRILGFSGYHLIGLFALQTLLGVEAYMGKFAATGAQAHLLPAAREVTVMAGWLRSFHVLIGTAILASSVVLALRVFRQRHDSEPEKSPTWSGVATASEMTRPTISPSMPVAS